MVTLVTAYWGDPTTGDARLQRIYERVRTRVVEQFNRDVEGTLKIVEARWIDRREHLLVRGSHVIVPPTENQLESLAQLLIDTSRGGEIGTGVALYGLHASSSADTLRNRIDSTRPVAMRFIADERTAEELEGHMHEWFRRAAEELILRESTLASEVMLDRLAEPGPRTQASERTWTMI